MKIAPQILSPKPTLTDPARPSLQRAPIALPQNPKICFVEEHHEIKGPFPDFAAASLFAIDRLTTIPGTKTYAAGHWWVNGWNTPFHKMHGLFRKLALWPLRGETRNLRCMVGNN